MAEALRAAVAVARLAPSVLNTQPWRWRLRAPDVLELWAQRSRQLEAADPDGRLLIQSCGAALHHAQQSLLADGWASALERLPDGDEPDLVGRLRIVEEAGPDPEAELMVAAARQRHTDRRPVADTPVPAMALEAIGAAATARGISWHRVAPDRVVELTVAAADADAVESSDGRIRAEVAAWVGGARPDGTGIPDSLIPSQPLQTRVPGRFLGSTGTLDVGTGHDAQATHAILHGGGDEPRDWLAAGEALSAAWLTATGHGVALLPISTPVEVPSARMALRRMLAGIGFPYLAVRLGYPDPHSAPPAHTPRLDLDAILTEVDAVR